MPRWTRLAIAVGLLAAPLALAAQNPAPKSSALDGELFESAVRPAQSLQCFSCHGLDQSRRNAWFEPSPPRPTGIAVELDELLDSDVG